jgi:hypothetical protein
MRPKLRVSLGHTDPPISTERPKKVEAETLPPPALSDPPPSDPVSPARVSMRIKKEPNAATVDEVTADLSKDPRRER